MSERWQEETFVDSRPSDAVAVALRARAPIFIEDSIIEQKVRMNWRNGLKILNQKISGMSCNAPKD